MNKLKLFIFIIPFTLFGAEVDHFLAIDQDIKDSKNIIDERLHEQAQSKIIEINKNRPDQQSCYQVLKSVRKNFKNGMGYKVNKYIRTEIDKKYLYPGYESKKELVENSIFRDNRFLKFAPVMDDLFNYNGIYVGVDKLSHFFAMGWIFFKRYLYLKKKGYSEDEINLKIYKMGSLSEKTYLGMIGTKTYSYADLESNYQGFLFFKDFCHSETPLLVFQKGKWSLRNKVSLSPFVNPHWNELFNPAAYTKNFKESVKDYSKKYCEIIKESESFKKRMSYYSLSKWKKSSAQSFIESQRDLGLVPDNTENQLKNLCFL